jgi:hypothetical protein
MATPKFTVGQQVIQYRPYAEIKEQVITIAAVGKKDVTADGKKYCAFTGEGVNTKTSSNSTDIYTAEEYADFQKVCALVVELKNFFQYAAAKKLPLERLEQIAKIVGIK